MLATTEATPKVDGPSTASPYALEMDAVSVRHGDGPAAVDALSEVTIGFARGSVTAIIGAPGAGKSTLVECATGVREPTGGWVGTHDAVVTADPAEWAALPPADPARAELLVADDLMAAEHLYAMLGAQGDGRTVVVTTSSPAVAAAADVALFLVGGRLVDAACGMSAQEIGAQLESLTHELTVPLQMSLSA
ncbi:MULTISPECIES: ATP-binding cassette domain-containing protein [Streptomyces]|uniref:ABC transporter domain-containing protein n=1 Tax=Streptomyces cacaoi TaxID=1898 RepID=A0A4Y3R0F3_STRCI|nr:MULTISPECIES: ATP-binding cassette domain-containing protein [Streptomyces]NNG85970.1 ATP-binding cassette domain-containing protein [Streptomyces cacaoi]QHF93430.1 hypothetical protein DEH18_05545 [Streptomyces sp. NHF165]GEB51021.1 hypothetical protein SCA03_35720 [Streptomyces cacaoi]